MDKLCIDCKHYVLFPEHKDLGDQFEHNCSKDVGKTKSMVTGEMVQDGSYYRCTILRGVGYTCGPEGKLWKEKQINRINLDASN